MVRSPEMIPEILGGYVVLFQIVSESLRGEGMFEVMDLMIFMSVSMGIFNLLPHPGLDGSQLALLVIEKLRGRSLGSLGHQIFFWAALITIGGLLLIMLWNDVMSIFAMIFPSA